MTLKEEIYCSLYDMQ